MRKIRAFTLIELLVVLSIAGILATFVGPVAYQQYLSVQRDAEVEKLRQVISQTQFYALNQRRWTELLLKENTATILSEMSEKVYEFEYLSFAEQKVMVNPNGFFQQRQLTYRADERNHNLIIGRDLYEQN